MNCAPRSANAKRFYIESHYYDFVTGDLEKARQVYELWVQTYPREVGTADQSWACVSNSWAVRKITGRFSSSAFGLLRMTL